MNDWDQEIIEAGDEEKQFNRRLLVTGDKVGAAKGTIVPPDSSNAVAAREADKALRNASVQADLMALMNEVGMTDADIVRALKRNLTAEKMGIVQKTGDVVSLGDDGMVQIQAAKILLQARGFLTGGAKAEPTERDTAPPAIQVNFNVRNVRSNREEDDDVIDGDYTVSS